MKIQTKQSILKILGHCLEISKKESSNTHGIVTSKIAQSETTSRTNAYDHSRTRGVQRATVPATVTDRKSSSSNDTQLNKEQSAVDEQERFFETFEYLMVYFFEFYVCRGSELKQIIELNGKLEGRIHCLYFCVQS